MVWDLQKNWDDTTVFPHIPHPVSPLFTSHVSRAHLSQPIVIQLLNEIHTYLFRSPYFSPNIFFLFQEPIQDTALHLAVMSSLRLFLALTVSQNCLVLKTLTVLRSPVQAFCTVSLSWVRAFCGFSSLSNWCNRSAQDLASWVYLSCSLKVLHGGCWESSQPWLCFDLYSRNVEFIIFSFHKTFSITTVNGKAVAVGANGWKINTMKTEQLCSINWLQLLAEGTEPKIGHPAWVHLCSTLCAISCSPHSNPTGPIIMAIL